MKKHTMTAVAITALMACGAAVAGEGVEIQQTDPYGSGNWQAQATTALTGSELDQNQPQWSQFHAQTTDLIRGSEISENPADPRNFTAQPTMELRNRERRGRVAGLLPDLCDSRLVRAVFEAVDIQLNCP